MKLNRGTVVFMTCYGNFKLSREVRKFGVKSLNSLKVWAMEAKFRKFMKILNLVTSETVKIPWGAALRAMFKINMAGRDCSAESK